MNNWMGLIRDRTGDLLHDEKSWDYTQSKNSTTELSGHLSYLMESFSEVDIIYGTLRLSLLLGENYGKKALA